jgi:hypothetical protein
MPYSINQSAPHVGRAEDVWRDFWLAGTESHQGWRTISTAVYIAAWPLTSISPSSYQDVIKMSG